MLVSLLTIFFRIQVFCTNEKTVMLLVVEFYVLLMVLINVTPVICNYLSFEFIVNPKSTVRDMYGNNTKHCKI